MERQPRRALTRAFLRSLERIITPREGAGLKHGAMDAAAIIEALAPFPRGGIAQLPTPLEPAPGLAAELGLSALAVKRDDRTSPRYGGNKVRKLDFLLGQALAEGRRAEVTF